VLSNCRPILSLLRPFPTFIWHHAAIHLIVSTIPTPTPTQEVTLLSTPHLIISKNSLRNLSDVYTEARSYSPVILLTHLLQFSSSIDLYILDEIDKHQLPRPNPISFNIGVLEVLNYQDLTFIIGFPVKEDRRITVAFSRARKLQYHW